MPKTKLRRLETIQLAPTDTFEIEADEEARVLAGYVNHITGTISQLTIGLKRDLASSRLHAILFNVLAAVGSADYVINPHNASSDQQESADPTKIWFNSFFQITFTGGTASFARLLIEVVKIDPVTGEHLA